MQHISLASALHKAKIATTSPWHVLLTIFPDMNDLSVVLRLVREPQDVEYQGNSYVAFNFDFDAIEDKSSGELTQIVLRVCNINRLIHSYLEQYDGGVGAKVELRVVSEDAIQDDPSLYMEFQITEVSADSEWASFTLGADSPMRASFPKFLYLNDFCIWQYNSPTLQAAGDPKGAQCGYVGGLATCKKTLADCRAHANSARFGGFPGIDSQGFRTFSIV